VARDGHTLLKKGYGLADRESGLPNTPQTRFRIGSLTQCDHGWFIRDVSGGQRITHTGLLYGYSAIIARFPAEAEFDCRELCD